MVILPLVVLLLSHGCVASTAVDDLVPHPPPLRGVNTCAVAESVVGYIAYEVGIKGTCTYTCRYCATQAGVQCATYSGVFGVICAAALGASCYAICGQILKYGTNYAVNMLAGNCTAPCYGNGQCTAELYALDPTVVLQWNVLFPTNPGCPSYEFSNGSYYCQPQYYGCCVSKWNSVNQSLEVNVDVKRN